MREIRLYGSEGGGALTGSPYPYLSKHDVVFGQVLAVNILVYATGACANSAL